MKNILILFVFIFNLIIPFDLFSQWLEIDYNNQENIHSHISNDKNGNLYNINYHKDSNGYYQIRKWEGDHWLTLPNSSYFNGYILKIDFDSKGNLYACGWFRNNSTKEIFIAKWDGHSWSKFGNTEDPNNFMRFTNIAIDSKDQIYVDFTHCDYVFANNLWKSKILKWSGNEWIQLNYDTSVYTFNISKEFVIDKNDNLYITGAYSNFNDIPNSSTVSYVAKWNGIEMSKLGVDNLRNSEMYSPYRFGKGWSQAMQLEFDNFNNLYLLGTSLAYGSGPSDNKIYNYNGNYWGQVPHYNIFNSSSSMLKATKNGSLYLLTPDNELALWEDNKWTSISQINGEYSAFAKTYEEPEICEDFNGNLYTVLFPFENISGGYTFKKGAKIFKYFVSPPILSHFNPSSSFKSSDTVMIFGKNLFGVTAVTFGSDTAKFYKIINDSSMYAIIGPVGGDDIKVRNPAGLAILQGLNFIPAPKITSFTPNTADVGETVTIIGSNFNDASSVTFGGYPAKSFSILSSGTIQAVLDSGNTGYVSVVTPGGVDSLTGFIHKFVKTGMDELVFKNIQIYPNPAQDVITIQSDYNLKGQAYSIYDCVGKLMNKGVLNENNNIISTQELTNGIYTLEIGTKNRYVVKLVKQSNN